MEKTAELFKIEVLQALDAELSTLYGAFDAEAKKTIEVQEVLRLQEYASKSSAMIRAINIIRGIAH